MKKYFITDRGKEESNDKLESWSRWWIWVQLSLYVHPRTKGVLIFRSIQARKVPFESTASYKLCVQSFPMGFGKLGSLLLAVQLLPRSICNCLVLELEEVIKSLSVLTSLSSVNLLGFFCIFYPSASFFWIRSHNLFKCSFYRTSPCLWLSFYIYFPNSIITLEKLGNKTAFLMYHSVGLCRVIAMLFVPPCNF